MKKIIKYISGLFILSFLVMLFISTSGYYEYELNKKTILTNEAIGRFEKDVKEGKNLDVNNYLTNTKKDYDNSFTKVGKKLSNSIGKSFSSLVKFLFNKVNKAINE